MFQWMITLSFVNCLTCAWAQSGADSALHVLFDSLKGEVEDRSSIYQTIAEIYYDHADYDSAEQFYHLALNLTKAKGDQEQISTLLNDLGVVKLRKGDTDSSIYYYEQALKGFMELRDPVRSAFVEINLGIIYKNKGQYGQAWSNLSGAAQKLEKTDEKAALSSCYNTIAIIYSRQQNFDKSLEYHRLALRIRQELGMEKQIASSLNNIGIIFRKKALYDSALFYYQRSLAIKRRLNNARSRGSTLNNIGTVLMDLEKFNDAEPYLLEALSIRSGIVDKAGETITLNNLGRLYIEQKQYSKALTHLERGATIAHEVRLTEEIKDNLALRINAHEHLNHASKALELSQRLMQLKDSLFNVERKESLTEMQTRYETEKKEQEIELLESNRKLQEARLRIKQAWIIALVIITLLLIVIGLLIYSKLKTANKNKRQIELLLQEMHHRVKNNLQLLSSIFSLKSRELSDRVALDAVKSSENRVNAMALIHQKLYALENKRTINLKDYLGNLVEELVHSYGYYSQQNIKLSLESFEIDVDKAVPIGLIVNELASNTLKHVFPKVSNAKLTVSARVMNGSTLKLEVSDNGEGFQYTAKPEESMGLNIIETLSRQLKARAQWATNHGVRFNLEMPIN